MRILLWLLIVLASFAAGFFLNRAYNNGEGTATSANENALLVANTADTNSLARAPVTGAGYTSAEEHTIRLFQEAAPSVCFITTTNLQRDYFSRDVMEIPRGSGSGFVWDRQGHIVTNYHVIQGADRAQVTLSDGQSYPAEVVGYAAEKDLAVLRINTSGAPLRPIPVGTSQELRVGQSVYAIGNPFGLDQSLTTGVVSAVGREIESVAGIPIRDVIQTDAAINPGNSGGPLLDSNGRLIGVNTAIYSPSGASAGIGFSIPVDAVRWVVPELIQYGKVRRPTLGVELTRPLRNVQGAAILDVVDGSAASRAGLRGIARDRTGNLVLGDVIVGLNQTKIASANDLILELEKYEPGDEVELTILRDQRPVRVRLRLDASR